jgi:autophagy-related protein 16
MEVLHQLVLERNARETTSFVEIHEASSTLLNQLDALQAKCDDLERELVVQQEKLESAGGPVNGAQSASIAIRNEVRLREKLEKLQEELNEKMKQQAEENTSALETAKELSKVKDLNVSQESTIANLKEEERKKERAMEHLSNELEDAKSRTKLAEQQYVGLKDTIRVLQDENDLIKKENRELESRFVSEKEKMSSEMNKLTEIVDRLKQEADMLRALKSHEEKRKSWFGLGSSASPEKVGSTGVPAKEENKERKWGGVAVVVPTTPKQVVTAHNAEAPCVR